MTEPPSYPGFMPVPARRGNGLGIASLVVGLTAILVSAFVIWLAFGTELVNEDYQHCFGYHNGMAQSCEQYR